MTEIDLKTKWIELSGYNITTGYKSLRISAECFCELYIGLDKDSNRCLILTWPDEKRLDFTGVQKENLCIYYYREKNMILLQLMDNEFKDLFDDLIISLHQGIKDLYHVDEYCSFFINAFYRWSEFFEDRKSDLLSEDIIKGMIGELIVLKKLINESKDISINNILNAWRGPYDKGNDFELENRNIEVKTKSSSGVEIKISSEYQLEVEQGKGLYLIVVSIDSNNISGIHLRDIVSNLKTMINESSGDATILWKALRQKNITQKTLIQYDNYRFQPISLICYDCTQNGFPRLSKSNIPEAINGLKYNLRTSLIEKFIIEQRNL